MKHTDAREITVETWRVYSPREGGVSWLGFGGEPETAGERAAAACCKSGKSRARRRTTRLLRLVRAQNNNSIEPNAQIYLSKQTLKIDDRQSNFIRFFFSYRMPIVGLLHTLNLFTVS
jgi:hypothetical protein